MLQNFYKYQGTGNDFIIIDNRMESFPKDDAKFVAHLCDRRFGIGADGLILLENDPKEDFNMTYFNADGNPGSMCGNGGRCIVAFAQNLGIIKNETTFNAVDGLHRATINDGIVTIQMQNVSEIREKPGYAFLNTGSPHHVQIVGQLDDFDVKKEGARLRYGMYGQKGSNINFVEKSGGDSFSVRTYERGVENETLSCGTGVTAVALAMHNAGVANNSKITVHTKGGELQIVFKKTSGGYSNIYLTGPAKEVFNGNIAW